MSQEPKEENCLIGDITYSLWCVPEYSDDFFRKPKKTHAEKAEALNIDRTE